MTEVRGDEMTSNSVPVRDCDVSHEQDRVVLAQTKDWEVFWDIDHQVVGLLYVGWDQAAGVTASGFVRQLRALDLPGTRPSTSRILVVVHPA